MEARGARGIAGAIAALLVCAGLVAVSGGSGTSDAQDAACVPTGPRSTVEQLNEFVDSSPGVADFLGADVGVDVRLDAERSLWFFADTLRRTASGVGFVRNSALLFTPGCVRLVRGAGGGAVIPDREDGVGYWPMSVWKLDHGDEVTVYVMAQRVAPSDEADAPFDFVTLGPAVAAFRVSGTTAPRLVMREDLGPDDPSPEEPEWGAASAVDGPWLYLYGTSTRDLPGVHGFALRVARVAADRVADQTRWRYWDGRRWGADEDDAVPLIGEQGGVSQTLSVWSDGGRWYALSKQDEFLGHAIVVWPAASPAGPFGPARPVAELPCDAGTGELRYMPLAHPELLPEPGTVVVSYSRNFLDLGQVCAAPSRYRPHFIRVDLPD